MIDSGTKVDCAACETKVDKMQARAVSIGGVRKFECFECYRKTKNSSLVITKEHNVKLDLFCARCKYKFKSRDPLCPYCSKSDMVGRADVSIRELL